jgi:DNA-binding transcriptional regulator YdaS (Cro superfamily)
MDLVRTITTTRGAVTAVAEKLGISQAAVSQWRGRGIPADRVEDVRRALDAHLEELRTAGIAPRSKKQKGA